ncbi:MAG: threonine/serine exporter family protein [Eubacteriales bacterium]|nr:threonine/serine exporter family protein [Eubacteriales bacterium]
MADDNFKLSVDLAKQTIECGGEVSRSEETIRRINQNDCSVFALPSLIVAQKGNETQVRRIYKSEINLASLARINSVSRKLANESNMIRNYKAVEADIFLRICDFLACASFSIFFGGNITDAAISGIIATIISIAKFNKLCLNQFSNNLISSFIAGVLSFVPILLKMNVHQDKIIIGTIMLFVPGLTVVNAIRDMMNSDLLAGMYELFGAIMSALSIAFGIAGAFWLFGKYD